MENNISDILNADLNAIANSGEKHEKRKKRRITWLIVFCCCIVLICLSFPKTLPYIKYESAKNKLSKGQYQEAILMFEELSSKRFKDADMYLSESQ